MKLKLNFSRLFLFLTTILIAKYFLHIYSIILIEKSSINYEENIIGGTRLSRETGSELTPPHLVFNHSAVLAAGIDSMGALDEVYFYSNQEQILKRSIGKTPTNFVAVEAQVIPFFGNKLGRVFYDGMTYDSKLVIPQVNSDMQELIGRRGRIAYEGGLYSDDVFILEVGDGYLKITGLTIYGKQPIGLELYKVSARSNFTVPIERISHLPFIEDGVGRMTWQGIAVRLKDKQSILRGDAIEVNGKKNHVLSVLNGPGELKFLVTKESHYRAYIDTRQPTVNVLPTNTRYMPPLFLNISNVTNDELYLGQQSKHLISISKTDIKIPEIATLTLKNYSFTVSKESDEFFSLDKRHASLGDQSADKIQKQPVNSSRPLSKFEYHGTRKNIPVLITFRGEEKKDLFSVSEGVSKRKQWMGEQLWSTYTGLLNQYYNTFNPSGFEYIIHALGSENRDSYWRKFIEYSPEYVQTSIRNFDLTDFHGWSLTNSWSFYRLLLASYTPLNAADYAQIWGRVADKVIEPKYSLVKNDINFPISVASPKSKYTCNDIRVSEVNIEYELNNTLRSVPLIGKTPRIIIYVNDALSELPISLPPDSTSWVFPVAYKNGQFPKIDIKVYSPILPMPEFIVKNVEIRDLDVQQKGLRALFLPSSSKDLNLCGLK
jgi:hypothetical protein